MQLKKIIENLNGIKKIEGRTSSIEIEGLACDSKAVKKAHLFLAVKGSSFDGVDFIDEAIDRGALAVILPFENRTHVFRRSAAFIYVDDARSALSQSCVRFFGDVSKSMHLIGVTGTNGKTTTTYLLESLLKIKAYPTGVIGTINYRFGDRIIPARNTTPGSLELYSLLSSMHNIGIKNCVLEVSSHSLEQGRVEGLDFDIAVFTNLANDHLDYHKNIENYFASKAKLFSKIKPNGHAVLNIDDVYSEKIIKEIKKESIHIITYGIERDCDVCAKDIRFSFDGLGFGLCVGDKYIDIQSSLIGQHNIYNILASAACGVAMGMELEEIKRGVQGLRGLPGRLERIDCGQDFLVFVDYAHTEDGLKNVLDSLKALKPNRVLTVFGCGGDRDQSKRPRMGKVSSELSDKIFITSDNPRNESPMDIISQITKGIKKHNYIIEPDRFKAIQEALKEGQKNDIVLVAGKGHETYQIFKDTSVPFDDREVVKRILGGTANR